MSTEAIAEPIEQELTPLSVHVEWPVGTPFEQVMDEVREWLERQNIQSAEIEPTTTIQGTGFQVRFGSEDDARLFLREFSPRFVLCGGKIRGPATG